VRTVYVRAGGFGRACGFGPASTRLYVILSHTLSCCPLDSIAFM